MTETRVCPFEEDVLLLEDHDLPFARRIVVEAHLAVCASCAEAEETLEIASRALRAAPEEPLGVIGPALARLAPRKTSGIRPVLAGSGLLAAAAALLAALFLSGRDEETPEAVVAKLPLDVEIPIEPPALRTGPDLRARVSEVDVDGEDRFAAYDRLAAQVRSRGAAGSSELAGLLDPDEPQLARRALAVAERVPSPRLTSGLVILLRVEELSGRAARLLGVIGERRAVPELEKSLDGPAAAEAREALVSIRGSFAENALARRLDRQQEDAPAVLDALIRVAPRRGAAELVTRAGDERLVESLLARRGERLVPELRRLLRSSDLETASTAARLLGVARDEASLAVLAGMARRRGTAAGATSALLALGTPAAFEAAFVAAQRGGAPCLAGHGFDGFSAAEPYLLEQYQSGSAEQRRAALELLGRCGGAETVALLSDPGLERRLRTQAIETLGRIGGSGAVAVLERWGEDPRLRARVIDALGATRDPAAVSVLERWSADRRSATDATHALAAIASKRSAAVLVRMLRDPHAGRAAERALARMPEEVVVPVLLERFEQRRDARAIRHVLTDIAGANHGSRADAWKKWWNQRP